MQNSKTFLLVLLGILAAFGPFVTDMYLPGLPSMTVYFDTTASMVQLGITTAMLGLGFGQIIVGPLSDKYGRKLPLLLSLWLFIFSTIACICSWSIGAFIFFRFLQGIAGAGGIVISRSVATDCYGGKELAKACYDFGGKRIGAYIGSGGGRSYVEIYQLVGYFCFSTVFRSSVAFTLLAPERAFTS